MTGARRGPFRPGILELLAGANQDVVAPLLLAPRGGFARAGLALLLVLALALACAPWVPLRVAATGRLVRVDGARARFVSAAPVTARPGARVRLVVVDDETTASLTLDGRVVGTERDVVEVALEGDVTPGAGAAVARFTAGRASPVALLLRPGGAP